MKLFLNLSEDLARHVGSRGVLQKLKVCLFSHSFHMVMLYRAGVACAKIPMIGGGVRIIFEYVMRVLYASDISMRSSIGAGLLIMHGHDIVIGSEVRIGRNCKILNGVTLGNKDTESTSNQQPSVGDNVVLGSGAKILGNIIIGHDVVVGANSVVLKDVPDGVTVAGVPAKIIVKTQ